MASLVLAGNTSGSITISSPAVAGTNTLTLPASTGTVLLKDSNNIVSVSGVQFPATQSASADANTLDDYEEGTWTPTVQGTSTAGAATYGTRIGKYTKIGNTVNIMCSLSWTAHTGSGDVTVGGLPFVSATYSGNAIWQASPYGNNMNFGTSATSLVALIVEASDTIIFRGLINNTTRASVPLDTSVDNLAISITYYV